VGVINTPTYIYKKITVKKDPSNVKVTNFKIFGVDEKGTTRVHNPVSEDSTMLLLDDSVIE